MLDLLEKQINYIFQNKSLLKEALTHPSLSRSSKISPNPHSDYERLEFLGDAVLGMIIAEMVLASFPEEAEGLVAKRHAALVCGSQLATVARELKLGSWIFMSSGEEASGGRETDTNLENVLEALIAALYLDGGFEVAKKFVQSRFEKYMLQTQLPPRDPKSTLQEWAQGQGKPLPSYEVVSITGPSHAPLFTIRVSVLHYPPVTAEASSKRSAEREAARLLLERLERKENTNL